jgi:hypothetical protein
LPQLPVMQSIAVLSFLTAGILSAAIFLRDRLRHRGTWFWLLTALGLPYLALDEQFSIHEHLGEWLHDAQGVDAPGFNHTDDAVLLAMAVVGFIAVAASWRELLRFPAVLELLGIALALFSAAILLDSTAPVEGFWPRVEEWLELLGSLVVLAAVLLRWRLGSTMSS